MTGFAFDANILIDALNGYGPAHKELRRIRDAGSERWISRMAWIEVLSKGPDASLPLARRFLSGFGMDEIDAGVAERAAALRRDRPKLRSPDAIILASAQLRGRTLVTRNTRDFPANLPGVRVPYLV